MGTTAEKGAYIIETKSLLKQKINNLGGSIDDNTTFRNYANQLQNVYDNLPKTDYAEGTEVNLGKTIKGKLDFDKIYQEVEYISGTGTQYINTGVLGGLDKKVIIKCSVKSIADYTLYGSRQSTGNTVSYISTASATSSWQSGLGSSWLRAENNSLVVDEVCTIESYLSSGEQYIKKNGTIIYSGNREVSLATFTQNDYLLAFNNQGSASQMANANLYDCKVYQNNVLVRHFIPCYRKTDNVIGLYDKVEGKFYTNAGTETFTKGADVGNGFGDIVGIGQSEQYSTTGKNLFNAGSTKITSSGIEWTPNADGSFSLSGTAINTSTYGFIINVELPAGSYVFSIQKTLTRKIKIRVHKKSGSYQYASIAVGSLTSSGLVLQEEADNFQLYIDSELAVGDVLNDKIYFQFESGSTATSWEPYTGRTASTKPNLSLSYPMCYR